MRRYLSLFLCPPIHPSNRRRLVGLALAALSINAPIAHHLPAQQPGYGSTRNSAQPNAQPADRRTQATPGQTYATAPQAAAQQQTQPTSAQAAPGQRPAQYATQNQYTQPVAAQQQQPPQPGAQQPGAQQQFAQQANPPAGGPANAMQLNAAQAAQVAAAQNAALEEGAVNPVSPFPPLDPQWQAFLDQVLDKWETESAKVQRYECKFLRYQYDPTLANPDAYTIGAGVLKYMKPDKGMFKVEQLVYFKGLDKDNKPQYQTNPQKQFGEYWVCDGQYIDVRDENEKKCTKYQLPPQMQGNAIHMSPLPFVFGVKAADLKARYWIRPLAVPQGRKNEVWLEVYPRRADDAANYLRLQVVIDLQDWMPKGLIVFLPNWRPEAEHRELYEFKDREINAQRLLNALFQQEFIPKDPPKDWKVIIEPYQAPDQQNQPAPKVAAPPSAGPMVR